MLLCADNTYYVGVTNDLERRLYEHNSSYNANSYTSCRRPLKLVYSVLFNDINEAIAWEKRIKNWSQAKKKALIRGDWDKVRRFSSSRQARTDKVATNLN